MKKCTIGVTPLELLLNRPMGHLALRGFDGEDDGAKPDDNADNADDGADGKSENDNDSDKGGDTSKDKGDESRTLSESDFRTWQNYQQERERNVRKRKEAESKAADLEKTVERLKKDGISDEELGNRLKASEDAVAGLTETNRKLAMENAFLKDNTHAWVNPARALQLADLSEVEIDDDGSVHGLKTALDALAKSDPYLLQPKPAKDKDKDDDKPGSTGKPPAPRGGRRQPSASAAREAELRAKYPGLRR